MAARVAASGLYFTGILHAVIYSASSEAPASDTIECLLFRVVCVLLEFWLVTTTVHVVDVW